MEKKISIEIEGMTCVNCAKGISNFLEKNGAKNVIVDFINGDATFQHDSYDKVSIEKGIENLGYQVVSKSESHHGHVHSSEGLSKIEKLFYFSLIFTLPLFMHMFLPFAWLHNPFVQLSLCLPVFIVGMMHFGKSAYSSIKTASPNMDVLISLGAASAFIYSLVGLIMYYDSNLIHEYLFFETSATIITLVFLGNVLEHRSVKQTTTAMGELKKLQSTKAKRIEFISEEQWSKAEEVNYESIRVHDILLINSGDSIPVDGIVIWGNGTVDESMVSGESTPCEKDVNSILTGGTLLVNGNLRMKATHVGNDTLLSKIIDLVKNAQHSKPPIQKIGDKVSTVFVPVVTIISVLCFIITYFILDKELSTSIMNSIAILVISCPCAMGLATPTAVMVGIGLAAKKGVLIKGGDTLESFANIKNIVFDKTGTLTTGKFKIKNIKLFDENINEIHRILFNLEQHSSHPIAKSIIDEFSKIKTEIEPMHFLSTTEEKGLGITATDDQNNIYKAGSYQIAENLTEDKSGHIYITVNNQLKGIVYLEDEITQHAADTIRKLKSLHIHTVMLSGDRKERCAEIANLLGIDEVYAEKLPHEKLEIIKEIEQRGTVAMVGDGINDAPSLTAADIGVSMGNSTEAAIQSSKIILLKPNDLSMLYKALIVSKHTLLTIKQNLFWALIYNVVAIPIAAAGFLNPMVAALSMAFSDVVVVGNSLRLKIKKIF